MDLTKNAYILQQNNNILSDSININSPQNNHVIPLMNLDDRLINANTIKNYTPPSAFDKYKYLNSNILSNSNDKTNIKPYYANSRNTINSDEILNNLYHTPTYQNIQSIKINDILDNNYSNTTGTNNISNNELLHSFQNPKKEFLDMSWMINNKRTYNDNCIHCKLDSNIQQNKNAICSVVPYGRELSSCTNQDNTITQQQLDNISNNNPILH